MSFGLTSLGFIVKRLSDIKDEMVAAYQAALGTAINLGPRTPQGQVIANSSAELASLWEELENAYNSSFPDTAQGMSLDEVVTITGLTRIPQSKSRVVVTVAGVATTAFPVLKAHVAGNALAAFTATGAGIVGGGGTVAVIFESDAYGPVAALAGTLTVLDTPFPGVTSITNVADAALGRLVETDAELRIRRAKELQRSGTATVEGIRNALLNNVVDVVQALVIENTTDLDDGDGRPPHSFEAVVDGGLAQEIADEIWKSKPAGIQTYGNNTLAVFDSMGFAHMIKFSRPTDIPIYIIAALVKNADPTEPPVYPTDGDARVKQALVDYFDTMQIGQDVIDSLLFVPINTVEGILGITVYIDIAPAPSSTANIAIAANERAVTDLAHISIT